MFSMSNAFYVFCVAFCAQNAFAQMGPLNLDILDAGSCEPNNYLSVDVTSVDDTQRALTVNLTTPFDLDGLLGYSLVVDRIGDGEVQEGVFRKSSSDCCNDLEKFLGDLWIQVTTEMGMNEGCPKTQGSYYVENFPVDLDAISIEQFLYGRFVANIMFTRLGEDVSCIYIEFTNTPEGESV